MKKVISVLLLACMLLTLTACGSQPAAPATDPTAEPAAEATEAPAAETAEAEYKLGMGVSVSLDSTDTNKAQVDATVATVVTDSEGKIVLCRIDCAQNKMDVTGGQVDTAATYTTKRDLKYDYNMVKYGNAIAEWDAQAKAFADYTVGMTADEVSAMETTEHNGHDVTVDETLFASCTMDITGMRATIATAANNAR